MSFFILLVTFDMDSNQLDTANKVTSVPVSEEPDIVLAGVSVVRNWGQFGLMTPAIKLLICGKIRQLGPEYCCVYVLLFVVSSVNLGPLLWWYPAFHLKLENIPVTKFCWPFAFNFGTFQMNATEVAPGQQGHQGGVPCARDAGAGAVLC